MRWSFSIGRIAGIDLKVHGTFFLLLAWIGFIYYREGGTAAAIDGLIFILLIFLCVVLHEFGHALAARRYGIKTRDITLLPIGGLARLERMPDNPREEVVVALAGPAVNIIIAAALSIVIGLTSGVPSPEMMEHTGVPLALRLFTVNIWLVLFNMIPAFPMDGGRVFRALLAMRMNYARATQVAAKTGQGIAFIFFIIGLWWNPLLLLIAVFVYFGAGSELAVAEMRSLSKDLRVSAAMVTQFQSLPPDATLHEAVEALLSTSQHEFPITDNEGKIHGILTRDDMIAALRKSGANTPVTEVMRTQIPAVTESMLFEKAFAVMQECRCPALPVLDSTSRLVGLFTPENVGEMIMVQSALGARGR
ncbi:MAG TPA: site-2 protease family protein [Chthoniobacterales bacterium]|jgi:Zn-dependent protease